MLLSKKKRQQQRSIPAGFIIDNRISLIIFIFCEEINYQYINEKKKDSERTNEHSAEMCHLLIK